MPRVKVNLEHLVSKMPAADLDKTRVRSLWAAHLLSWTALIMVIVWVVAYQVCRKKWKTAVCVIQIQQQQQ